MKRRQFIVQIGGAALAWPFAVAAQRPEMPFIGFLSIGSPNERAHLVEGFRKGLKEGGYVDGKDVAIEYRWAEVRPERLPGLAAELVNRKVAVIVASGGVAPTRAAKSATSTIPIVFTGGQDPVRFGLVASLGRPGGNVTGVTNLSGSLNAKRLEMLRDLLPGIVRIAYLVNPMSFNSEVTNSWIQEIKAAATATGREIQFLNASNEREIDAAFAAIKQGRARALLVPADSFFLNRREQIVALAARHAIPASYPYREFAEAGGLISYGPDLVDSYREAGVYVARILKGAKPADLPVIQASKLKLVVNLKTAKKLGIPVSRDFLARVDEVIE